MTYAEMKSHVTHTVTIPDGYNGHAAEVGVATIEGTTYYVAACGYFRAPETEKGEGMIKNRKEEGP